MTRPEDKAGDCSAYEPKVRAQKVEVAANAPIQRPSAAEREANDRFFDPTAEPLTREETVLGWKILSAIAAVLVVIAVVAVKGCAS